MDKVFGKITRLYEDNLESHGFQSKAVGWNTAECQDLRFFKLSSLVSPDEKDLTVNDYGCGYGSQLIYLNSNGYDVSSYNGYDLSSDMLSGATEQLADYEETEISLTQSDVIHHTADYTFVSGTFNVRFDATDDEWGHFIESKLKEIDKYSVKGFGFNLLSTYVDWREPHLFYGDPTYWFDYCKKNFSTRVSLLHDYPLYEWTIIVRKG
mgnify:CR=1 FL=1|tara:strand:+ start:98 stop:724 length:627 start_codon:yes stop_codon:yes gene_type:complete